MMVTQHKNPQILFYKQVNKGKYKSVRHFELTQGRTIRFTELNISENRNFAKSKPIFWLKTKDGNKWGKYLTGLFETQHQNIYVGDLNKRTHLILFQFLENGDKLKVVIFNHFFTPHINPLIERYFN